jgi:hypothetical protein
VPREFTGSQTLWATTSSLTIMAITQTIQFNCLHEVPLFERRLVFQRKPSTTFWEGRSVFQKVKMYFRFINGICCHSILNGPLDLW